MHTLNACTHRFSYQNKQEDIYGNVGIYAKPASVETELYAQLKSFGVGSIPVEQIR